MNSPNTEDRNSAEWNKIDTPLPPFKRGRTGIKGRTKYIQLETGSWVTLNESGECHLGAFHKHLGTLADVARELIVRKEYADAWRINMQRAERERDAALSVLRGLIAAEEKAIVEGIPPEMDDDHHVAFVAARTFLKTLDA